jgi:purine nucleoside phosphorylase
MHSLGASRLIVTNAAGAINQNHQVGDIMLLSDHINFTGTSPLTLASWANGDIASLDMTHTYTPALRARAIKAAEKIGLTIAATCPQTAAAAPPEAAVGATCGRPPVVAPATTTCPPVVAPAAVPTTCPPAAVPTTATLHQGVYLGLRGPSFETPAEIRAFRIWGADAVGMSTVHEVIAAAALGMEVLGLSLLTNMAAGIEDKTLSTSEVTDIGSRRAAVLSALIETFLNEE